jgi:hypothetical protein
MLVPAFVCPVRVGGFCGIEVQVGRVFDKGAGDDDVVAFV